MALLTFFSCSFLYVCISSILFFSYRLAFLGLGLAWMFFLRRFGLSFFFYHDNTFLSHLDGEMY